MDKRVDAAKDQLRFVKDGLPKLSEEQRKELKKYIDQLIGPEEHHKDGSGSVIPPT